MKRGALFLLVFLVAANDAHNQKDLPDFHLSVYLYPTQGVFNFSCMDVDKHILRLERNIEGILNSQETREGLGTKFQTTLSYHYDLMKFPTNCTIDEYLVANFSETLPSENLKRGRVHVALTRACEVGLDDDTVGLANGVGTLCERDNRRASAVARLWKEDDYEQWAFTIVHEIGRVFRAPTTKK